MITVDQIENLISAPIYAALAENNGEKYEIIKRVVLELIETETGIDTSQAVLPEGYEWMIMPFAFLVEYTSADLIVNANPEYYERIALKYRQALEILGKHKLQKPRIGAQAIIGKMEGLYQ